MATQIVSANTNPTTVIVKDGGAKGETGDTGANGTGLNDIRYGLLSNPVCHLLKKNNLSAVSAPDNTDADVSVVRASIATYTDFYGVVQTAAINELRQEAAGWLIEGASTNVSLYSEDFSNTPNWGTGTVVTPNAIASPDGAMTADLVDVGTTASSTFLTQSITIPNDSATYSVSMYFKAGSNTKIGCRHRLTGGTAIDIQSIFDTATQTFTTSSPSAVSTFEALANGWYRIIIVFANNSTGNTILNIRWAPDAAGALNEGTGYFWGSQVESLGAHSSYIATASASVTRTRDSVSVSNLNNFLTATNGAHTQTFIFKAKPLGTTQRLYTSRALSGSTSRNYAILTAAGTVSYRDATGQSVNTPATAFNEENYIALVTDGDKLATSYANGVAGGSVTIIPIDEIDTTQRLFLGGDDGASLPMYGHISDFRVYNFALNQSEITYLNGV